MAKRNQSVKQMEIDEEGLQMFQNHQPNSVNTVNFGPMMNALQPLMLLMQLSQQQQRTCTVTSSTQSAPTMSNMVGLNRPILPHQNQNSSPLGHASGVSYPQQPTGKPIQTKTKNKQTRS